MHVPCDDNFMTLALACAARGLGNVEPNPMVGAILVRDGQELARGHHQRFGGPHAEVEAVQAARDAGIDVRGATLYVTLEPCSHTHKKTPPCAPMLAGLGLRRVVVAMEDPDPNVQGQGLAILRNAGVDVTTGVCEPAAQKLLRAYTKLRTKNRPWVICKWAQTADGFLALPPAAGRWISGDISRQDVHHLRSQCDAILVGVNTVLADDPLLNNRSGEGKQPFRIVLDTHLRIPLQSRLVQTAHEFPLLVVTQAGEAGDAGAPRDAGILPACPVGILPTVNVEGNCVSLNDQPHGTHNAGGTPASHEQAAALRNAGAEILELPADKWSVGEADGNGGIDLHALLNELGRRRMTHLLVEGGPTVLQHFLHANLADEVRVYTAPHTLGDEFPPETLAKLPRMDINKFPPPGMEMETCHKIGEDMLRCYA